MNGAKQFITNAGTDISGVVTITARTGEDEISNIVIENGTPADLVARGGRFAALLELEAAGWDWRVG